MNRFIIEDERPPIYISAGFCKEQQTIELLAEEQALAMQVLGSYSMFENAGNEGAVFLWDAGEQAAYNCVGLRNPGREAASKYLPDAIKKMHDFGQFALISVVALSDEDPFVHLPAMAYWAREMGADGVEVDVSCPNIEGAKICETPEIAHEIAGVIRQQIGSDISLSYKVGALPQNIIKRYQQLQVPVDYIDAINAQQVTMPHDIVTGMRILSPDLEMVGRSGPVIADLSRENLRMWASLTDYHILSVGGVVDGTSVYERTHYEGADMVGIGQAIHRVHNPRRLIQQIADEYLDFFI